MQIKRFHWWLLWTSTVLTGITGGVYLWMDRMLEPIDAWAVINHPLQPWVLKAHILVAPFLILAIGMIATDHIWKLVRAPVKRARRTGLSLTAVLPPMILTGYLIQAVTHVTWLEVIAWTHIVTGVLFVIGLGAHQWVQSRRRLVRIEGPRRPSAPDSLTSAAPMASAKSPLQVEARGRARYSEGEAVVAGASAGSSPTSIDTGSPTRTTPSSSTTP